MFDVHSVFFQRGGDGDVTIGVVCVIGAILRDVSRAGRGKVVIGRTSGAEKRSGARRFLRQTGFNQLGAHVNVL